MPDISTQEQIQYNAMDPYQVDYDNRPLINLYRIIGVVNNQVDTNTSILQAAQGSAANLAARLEVALNDDGTLVTSAVDNAEHNIAAHADGTATLTTDEISSIASAGYTVTNPVSFVRMLDAERAKLSLISDEATSLQVIFPGDGSSTMSPFADTTVTIADSEVITWSIEAPNIVQAHLNFSTSSLHMHSYGIIPDPANSESPDYINYVTPVAFMPDSLRVFVNGIRLNKTIYVYVPPFNGPNGTWMTTSYTEVDPADGTFSFNRVMNSEDIITVDFDISAT